MRCYNLVSAILVLAVVGCAQKDGAVPQDGRHMQVKQALGAPAGSSVATGTAASEGGSASAAAATAAGPSAGSAAVAAAASVSPATKGSLGTSAPVVTSGAVGGANLAAGATTGNSVTLGAKDPAEAASASLAPLKALVASGRPGSRGFRSAAEVGSASLAASFPVFFVALNNLQAYQAGQDPRVLLIDKQEVMFPVLVDEEVRSSVVVRKRTDGLWEASEFGRGNVVKAVVGIRSSVVNKRQLANTDLSLVEIPTLHARLLAHDESGLLMLTPVFDVQGTDLHAGETRSAGEVLSALQPLALRIQHGNQ